MPSCSRLRYLEFSPRASTSGWPADRAPVGTLILLHAFPLGARMWEPQQAIASQGWRVVMPQLRGFDCDGPDGPAVSAMEDYAGDVADLLQTLSITSAVIAGLSMGGYVAFELFRRAPGLFRALVLADTRAESDSADARTNRMRLIAVASTDGAAGIAREMLPKLLGRSTHAAGTEVEARVGAMIVANQPASLQAALGAMMTRGDSTGLLPSIPVPTLILFGEEDELTPPALGESMARAIPHAELVRIPGAGHLSSLEQPAAFNAALLRFLGTVATA